MKREGEPIEGGDKKRVRKSRFSEAPVEPQQLEIKQEIKIPSSIASKIQEIVSNPAPHPPVSIPIVAPTINAKLTKQQEELMKKAQAAVAAVSFPLPSPIVPVLTKQQQELIAKAQQASLLQRSIASQLAAARELIQKAKAAGPKPLLFDALGREIDEEGNLVKRQAVNLSSLKINQVAIKSKTVNPYMAHLPPTTKTPLTAQDILDEAENIKKEPQAPAFFDDSIHVKSRTGRKDKSFKFVEEGSLVKLEEKSLVKAAKQEIMERINLTDDAIKNAYEQATKLRQLEEKQMKIDEEEERVEIEVIPDEEFPSVEWWDLEFTAPEVKAALTLPLSEGGVDASTLAYKDLALDYHPTHNLVHHPSIVKVSEKHQPKALTLMLTKKERKKIRRKGRLERERDKQDLIRLGLIPKEQSKMKLSNLMKVLTDEAVAAPSAMEKKVRDQVEERLKSHNMTNLSRKLTPAERRAKKEKKLMEDTSILVHAMLYRVNDLSSGKKRFKVEMNAKQYNLTGHVVICAPENCCLVYVEGGPKGIRKYRRLMLNRIKWEKGDEEDDQDIDDDDDDDDEEDYSGAAKSSGNSSLNRCTLAWEGTVPRRLFKDFKFDICPSSEAARKHMKAKNCPQFWDLVLNC